MRLSSHLLVNIMLDSSLADFLTCETNGFVDPGEPKSSCQQVLGFHHLAVQRIIRVTLRLEGVKSVAIVRRERKFFPNALWEIRVRNKVTTKRYRVSLSLLDGSSRAPRFKAAVGDDFPREEPPCPRCGHRRLVRFNHQRAAHARFDDMKVSKIEAIQFFRNIRM